MSARYCSNFFGDVHKISAPMDTEVPLLSLMSCMACGLVQLVWQMASAWFRYTDELAWWSSNFAACVLAIKVWWTFVFTLGWIIVDLIMWGGQAMDRDSIAGRSGNTRKIAVVFGRNRNERSRFLVMWIDRWCCWYDRWPNWRWKIWCGHNCGCSIFLIAIFNFLYCYQLLRQFPGPEGWGERLISRDRRW